MNTQDIKFEYYVCLSDEDTSIFRVVVNKETVFNEVIPLPFPIGDPFWDLKYNDPEVSKISLKLMEDSGAPEELIDNIAQMVIENLKKPDKTCAELSPECGA